MRNPQSAFYRESRAETVARATTSALDSLRCPAYRGADRNRHDREGGCIILVLITVGILLAMARGQVTVFYP